MCGNFVIAIDGPSGSGKSTVAKLVARKVNAKYLDTGAIYRAVAFILDEWGIKPVSGRELVAALERISLCFKGNSIILNGKNVAGKIRNPEISSLASSFSALPEVRKKLLKMQRSQAESGSLVAEGRDMGTVIFPDAEIKIFLTASAEIRAGRRWKELSDKGIHEDKSVILDKIRARDENDSNREIAPLKKADDAFLIDTSKMSINDVVERIVELVNKHILSERRCR